MNYFLAFLLIVVLVIIGPLAILWALNTLFPSLALAYTFWNWLAVFVLGGVFKSNVNVNK
jgi:hypothetical protein